MQAKRKQEQNISTNFEKQPRTIRVPSKKSPLSSSMLRDSSRTPNKSRSILDTGKCSNDCVFGFMSCDTKMYRFEFNQEDAKFTDDSASLFKIAESSLRVAHSRSVPTGSTNRNI